jgi:hypothetical protein
VYTGFSWENLREKDHLEGPGVDGRIILRWIFWERDGGIDWIELVQDKSRWRAFEKDVTNLRVP